MTIIIVSTAKAQHRVCSWPTLAGWRQSSIDTWMVPFAWHSYWLHGKRQMGDTGTGCHYCLRWYSLFRSMQELAFSKIGSWSSVPNLECDFWPGPLGCDKVHLCNPLHIRLGTDLAICIRTASCWPWHPHMLGFGQTWQSTSAAAQRAVGAGQPHMLAFGQPSVSSGFSLYPPQIWLPGQRACGAFRRCRCSGCQHTGIEPLFQFGAAEDLLSTSGMFGYSSCPGDAVTCALANQDIAMK